MNVTTVLGQQEMKQDLAEEKTREKSGGVAGGTGYARASITEDDTKTLN